jgi:hypothetical protein
LRAGAGLSQEGQFKPRNTPNTRNRNSLRKGHGSPVGWTPWLRQVSVISCDSCISWFQVLIPGLSVVGARRSAARRRGPPKPSRWSCGSPCRAFVTSVLLPGAQPVSGGEHPMRWRRLYDWHGPFPCGFGCPGRDRLRTAFPRGAWRETWLAPLSSDLFTSGKRIRPWALARRCEASGPALAQHR